MVHGPETTARVVNAFQTGGDTRRVDGDPGPATGLAVSVNVPRRGEVERRWRSVISGSMTREEVHAWSDRMLTTGEASVADPWVRKGLQELHELDLTDDPDQPWGMSHGPSGTYVISLHEMNERLEVWLEHGQRADAVPSHESLASRAELARTGWHARWGAASAVGHDLRHDLADHWVRFHSLPESKRYPDTASEWAELDRRHHALFQELSAGAEGCSTWLVSLPTYQVPGSPHGVGPPCEPWTVLLGGPIEWETYPVDDYEECIRHLWLYEVSDQRMGWFERLLHAIAEDRVNGALIGPPSWNWLYHPYDGGADVVAPDPLREQLVQAHSEWVAPGPLGL